MTTDPEKQDVLLFAQKIFDSQPFSSLLDAVLVDASPTTAKISVTNRPELQQQHGFLHGGVVSYLADNSLTFAGGLALGGDALTSEFKINYVKPAVGDLVVAEAEAIATTRHQAVCRCDVFSCTDGDKSLIAVAQGTIVSVRKR
ncbi:MAG: PaaI family thioesterase [Corynebacterium sp.]|jgi:uncharacterized protein (TIGR00369 family)|uniref:PaaI family thioesterase n=1 Tax=Corynebacterium sp. TaxID=1720 RepID=UPI003F09F903